MSSPTADLLCKLCRHRLRSSILLLASPQEDEEKVLDFYVKIEEDIQLARDNNCYILIEMDANAKLGYKVIKNDPNPQSKSGSLLWYLVQRNNLKVVNATGLCEGGIILDIG